MTKGNGLNKKKAIVAGHICIDITPKFPLSEKKIREPGDILKPGKLINIDGVSISTGGAVANTGLAMNRLGADVRLLGKLGDDEFGRLILEVLKRNGYDGSRDMIIDPDSRTSYTVALAIPGIDRIFLHDPGANNTFGYEDLDFTEIGKADLFHFGYPPLMRRMYQNEGEELTAVYKKVSSLGLATSLDLAAVDDSSEAGKQDWKAILTKVLPYVDFFVPSIEELCYMLDRGRYDEWMERAAGKDVTLILDINKDIKPLADELLSLGAKVLLIKCGAPGMYFKTAGTSALEKIGKKLALNTTEWADQEIFEKSYKPSKVLSGTGAGDTSIAAFLTAILSGRKPQDALRLAAATGTCCVEAYDSLSGLLSFEELEEKIAAGWEKQEF
ncbi:MAG: carbohydrate kinase family protein [Lachnospiraceae bacterium]|nr:carbohydrate kinase family protein [Lachnospiraceae bacterium]